MSYYVYGHYDQDELVYIGYGKGGRAVKSEGRSEEHKIWMEEAIVNKVDFYNFFEKEMNRASARRLEKRLIKAHLPKFNKEYTEDWYSKRAAQAVEAGRLSGLKTRKKVITPDGNFDSLAEAGVFYGVNKNTIRNRVRKGWEGYAWQTA